MLKQKSRMFQTRLKWKNLRSIAGITIVVLLAFVVVTAEQEPEQGVSENNRKTNEYASGYLWENGKMIYRHVWPEMKFSWQIVLGTVIAFFGAAFGSVGGVGGGGIFVPMLTLIIGFDPKSSTAVSKCMITGAAGASVYYNLRLRHPTLDLPIIDYDLALLFQPMLVLGISIGVAFNVIFADWMVTVLLILLFIGTSTKAFFKGVETWKKETIIKQEAAKFLASSGTSGEPGPYKVLPGGPSSDITIRQNVNEKSEVSIIANICWKELCILIGVWGIILFLQITKENYTRTCSMAYWILNLLQVLYLTILKEREPYSYWRCSRQRSRGGFTGPGSIAKLQVLRPGSLFLTPVGIPIAIGASAYEAVGLYTGKKVIASRGQAGTCWSIQKLVLCCFCGILAGMVGGLLGLGGGFILGPLFLELGIPPQVSSATATFAMTFSSSMSVVQYYLLNRFPVPYAIYFFTVATVAALVGQHVVRKIVSVLGRASLIIFILAFTIFASAVSLGGVGISNIIDKIAGKEYLGFEDICAYDF